MKLMTIPAAALAATFVFAQSAQAREHHRHHSWRNVAYQRFSNTSESSFWQQPEFNGGTWDNTDVRGPYTSRRRRGRHVQEYAGGSWSTSQASTYRRSTYHGGLGGRPSAWCGWEMRQLVGGDPGPEYNLARNWSHWGRSGPAGVGAIVVWAHHVGKIVGGHDGNWVVESGNDGHALRTRPRSIAGAIAIRWG